MQDTQTVRAYPLWLTWANRPGRSIASALVVSLAVVGASLALNGTSALGWRAATRHTAQVSFALFLLAFLASSIARLWPGPLTRGLLARRRALGLAFATAHLVHGAAILSLARLDDLVFAPRVALYAGAFGFVLVIAMAATSNDAAQRLLGGRGWRGLHRFGQIYLFAIFAVTYAGRVAAQPAYWSAVFLLIAALAIRLAAPFQSRSLRSRTLPIE